MSSLSKKSFDASKCTTLLQLTLQRIKILRNKRNIIAKQSRDDVARLLEKGQDDSAKVRVEHVFREENIVAAYDLVEQYCQLIISRIATIKSQQVCPSDLKEAIASLIYAAPRCADLQELQKVRELFTSKYGAEFSATALDLRPDCSVDTQIVKKLSSLPPNSDARLKLLKEIAAERKIDWNYQKAVTASFRSKVDLLDGPKNFVNANQVSKVDTPTASDKQKLVSISMHGDGSSAAHIAVPSPAASLKAKMSSLDPSPHNVHSVANHEIDTNTKSKAADPAVRAQKASSETITDGRKEDHKSPGNSGVLLKPDHGTPSPKLDPYALAKEEGRMDYKNVTESIRQAQEPDKILKGVEQERNTSAYDKYARQPTGGVQDRKVSNNAPKHEDVSSSQRSKEKGEGSRNHNTISPHTRHQTKDSTSEIQKDQSTLQELSEGNSTRHTSIVPPELTRERVKAEPEFDDLETAAEVVFASAARAAEAAKAAIDMVHTNSIGRPIRKMVDANSLQRGHYLNSSFGSGKRENHKVTEGTSKGMDSEHSFERENLRRNSGKVESGLNQDHVMHSIVHHQVPGPRSRSSLDVIEDAFKNVESEKTSSSQKYMHVREKSGKVESGLNQGHVNLSNNVMHSIVHHEVPGPRARSSSDMIEDGFKYVESEKTISSQKYIQTSTQAEMLNSKAEACDFSHVRDEATRSLRNDPSRLGTCDLEHEEPSGSHELGSSEAFIKTSIRRFAEPYSEGVKKHETSSTRKQESSFDHTQLYQEEKRVLYDSQMPQFDAYSSDDSSEEEPLFYTKGRAAMAREDYGQVAKKASFNKPKQSMSKFSPFTEQGSDNYVHESSNSIIHGNVQQESSESLHLDYYAKSMDVFHQKSSNSHYHHSNLEINSIQSDVQEHSQKPQFDDYAESVDLSTWSSKSPVRTHAGDMNTGIRSDGLVTSHMVDNDSYHKPTTRQKLRWQASTSEESDFYSQSDEVSTTLISVKMPAQRQDQSGYGYGDLPTQANRADHRKLSWHPVSEELDFPSKPSLEAGKLRLNFTTSKEFNSEPSLEVSKLKPSSRNEDETRAFKQGRNPGSTTEVTQASTGKSYYGLSRRTIPKPKQDVLPPTSSYESTNSLSIADENNYRYR